MPFTEAKGAVIMESATVTNPTLSTGSITLDVTDLVSVESVLNVFIEQPSGLANTGYVDDYSISGNSVTVDLQDGAGADLTDSDIDEITVLAEGV